MRDILQAMTAELLKDFEPEKAHALAIKALRAFPVANVTRRLDLSRVSQNLIGLHFAHPIGLAAGFDKQAEVFDKLGRLGFSWVEVGTVTPRAQPGNPKPRLFRLPGQQAIINRYGFNSKGAEYVALQFKKHKRTCVTGINLGKNKDTQDAVEDFLCGADMLCNDADFLTINISSPNTPGLRELQQPEFIASLINDIRALLKQKQRFIPVFVKLSPDMPLDQEASLIECLLEQAIDGIVICNTTVDRDCLLDEPYAQEVGGLSGAPLRVRANNMLRRVYRITQGQTILIGCGGIHSGLDAYERLRAGANLLQLYTAFVYQGPRVLRTILSELNALFERDGVTHISEIIGCDAFLG